jgi:hypothetical protein
MNLLITLCLIAPLSDGAVIRVAADGSGDFGAVQEAIAAAATGDVIQVGPGTYESDAPVSFLGKAITVESAEGAEKTVLRMGEPADPDRASVVVFESGETAASILRGFTITGGRGTLWGPELGQFGGGGVFCGAGTAPAIKGCIVTGNRAWVRISDDPRYPEEGGGGEGGGLLSIGLGPTVSGCTFSGNVSFGGGGGVTIRGGSPTFTACTFTGNLCRWWAGGLFFDDEVQATITDCTIAGNCSTYAGGLFVMGPSDIRIDRCLIAGNASDNSEEWGGNWATGAVTLVLTTMEMTASTIAGNFGILPPGYTPSRHPTSALWNNQEVGPVTLSRCVLWTPIPADFPVFLRGRVSLSESLLTGDSPFVRAGTYEYGRFRDEVIAGKTFSMPDFIVDAGDYTLRSDVTFPPEVEGPVFLRGDVNGDGQVSLSDVITIRRWQFVGQGGPQPTCMDAADVNDDGEADFTDGIQIFFMLFVDNGTWGTPSIPEPYPVAGVDVMPDSLGCESYTVTPAEVSDDVIRVGEVTASPGQEVEVPIFITTSVPVDAFQIALSYDPNLFTPSGNNRDPLDFEGTVYAAFPPRHGTDPIPQAGFLQSDAEEGVIVVGVVGDFVFDTYEIPPGEDLLVVKIRGTVSPAAIPGTSIEFTPTNGPDGRGVKAPLNIRNELTYRGETRFVSVLPEMVPGRIGIVDDIAPFDRGDSNSDGKVDISDPVFLLWFLFLGGNEPRCPDAADADDSGHLDLTDAVCVLSALFLGTVGEDLPAGITDPTADGLPPCRM